MVSEESTQQNKGLAIASLSIAIVCLPLTFGLLSFVGAIVGHIALSRLKATQTETHRGFAVAGIVIGWSSSIFSLIFFFALITAIISLPTFDLSSIQA
jgi:hypothetical protein